MVDDLAVGCRCQSVAVYPYQDEQRPVFWNTLCQMMMMTQFFCDSFSLRDRHNDLLVRGDRFQDVIHHLHQLIFAVRGLIGGD